MRLFLPAAVFVAIAAVAPPITAPSARPIPYADARAIVESPPGELPVDLRGRTPAQLEAAWPAWVADHNAGIRDRLARGDEDSLVNFWLYGTSFTRLPRVTEQEVARLANREAVEDLLIHRLDDLIAGLASPGANERLQFARRFLQRRGVDPSTIAGRERTVSYFVKARERMLADNDRYRRAAQSARQSADAAAVLSGYSTMYRDRGLSSDTRLTAGFAVDAALEAMKTSGRLLPGSVRRVALVGPGLDFMDKAEGYDFYPQQTIQPFALIDSLTRSGFAGSGDLRLSAFDLNPRVNAHLEVARQRARAGRGYVLQLPLSRDDPSHEWHPDLVAYWQRFGGSIGREVPAMAAPPGVGDVRVRAVRVRPDVVRSITPYDLNIIVERLEPLAERERFDLIVATNILVYYDAFDQALALANVSKMLRPGGFFLTNYAVSPSAPMEASASVVTPVYFDRQQNGDTLFWYQRR